MHGKPPPPNAEARRVGAGASVVTEPEVSRPVSTIGSPESAARANERQRE